MLQGRPRRPPRARRRLPGRAPGSAVGHAAPAPCRAPQVPRRPCRHLLIRLLTPRQSPDYCTPYKLCTAYNKGADMTTTIPQHKQISTVTGRRLTAGLLIGGAAAVNLTFL